MSHNLRLVPGLLVLLAACSGPKEAMDPHQLVMESEPGRDEEPMEAPTYQLASMAQCRSAMQHVVELGFARKLASARGAEERRQIEQASASPKVKERIEHGARDCLQSGMSQRETRCLTEAQSVSALDACDALAPR